MKVNIAIFKKNMSIISLNELFDHEKIKKRIFLLTLFSIKRFFKKKKDKNSLFHFFDDPIFDISNFAIEIHAD